MFYGKPKAVIDLLIARGWDINYAGHHGETLLVYVFNNAERVHSIWGLITIGN